MKAERMPYSALPSRPPLRWPNGARVAVWVVPNVEHYEYLPDPIRSRDPWPRMPHPDILGYGRRDYGNRVGFWRMTEVTDALGIPVTLSLNLANWERYPEIMEASVARGWDIKLAEKPLHGLQGETPRSVTAARVAMQEFAAFEAQLGGGPAW